MGEKPNAETSVAEPEQEVQPTPDTDPEQGKDTSPSDDVSLSDDDQDDDFDPFDSLLRSDVQPEPEGEPEGEPEQKPEGEPEGEGEGQPEPEGEPESEEPDDDAVAAQIEDVAPQAPAIPEGVPPEQWQQFQQWQQQQALAVQQAQQPTVQQAQQPTVQPPPFELSEEDFDKAFASREGLTEVLNKAVAAATTQAPDMNEFAQNMFSVIDQQVTYRTFFEKNADIDPGAESTLKAAAKVAARQPDASLEQRLIAVAEEVRAARDKAKRIKKSGHTTRIVRTAPKPNTGARDARSSARDPKEDALMAEHDRFQNLMSTMFQDDEDE